MKLFLFVTFSLLWPFISSAQFSWMQVGVNGLTCSQCCRSVEMSIRKLDFVDDVKMNLENTEGKITFKQGVKILPEKIAKAVTDAGFSVRYLKAGFTFSNVNVNDNSCYTFGDANYQFVKTGNKTLNGETEITFLGKPFQSSAEYKKWKQDLKSVCGKPKQDLFYITL